MSKSVIVGRPINGISINGLEYMMDDEGAYKIFENTDAAKKFLTENGFEKEDMDGLVFVESIGTCFRCGSPLFPSQTDGYTSQCFHCDEDFFGFEQDTEGKANQKLDITKMLTLSTAHITEDTANFLEQMTIDDGSLVVYAKGEYAYLIPLPDFNEDVLPLKLPEDLEACIDLARENECQWLCLDRDGETIDSLPEYDW